MTLLQLAIHGKALHRLNWARFTKLIVDLTG